jgi:hypothetical protein
MSREIYQQAVSGREDMSAFMIHLTRDDTSDGEGWYTAGFEAKENFRLIAEQKCLRAYKPHCLHRNKLWDVREDVQNAFKVICFTEAPLQEVDDLVKLIPGRKHKLEAYGYVFRRDFLIAAGAQQVMYVNEYDPFNGLRGPIDALFHMAHRSDFKGTTWRILPFISTMRDSYDYTWEREWRIIGEMNFLYRDLVCVIMPEWDHDGRDRWTRHGVPVISPGWCYERVLLELGKQLKRASGNKVRLSVNASSKHRSV